MSSLADIDRSIEALAGLSGPQLQHRLDTLAQEILALSGGGEAKHGFASLFDASLSAHTREFVAVCLLRVLAVNAEAFDDTTFRVKAFQIFDNAFQADVYPSLGIGSGDQTFEKQRVLKDVVPQAAHKLTELTRSVQRLDDLGMFRQKLMALLNTKQSARVLRCFIPPELTDRDLPTAIDAVDAFLTSDGPDVAEASDKARLEVARLREAASAADTAYAQELARVGNVIEQLVTEAYVERGLDNPAEMTAVLAPKRYPLHEGAEIELLVEVSNKGPGQAYDVSLRIEDAAELEIDLRERELGNWPVRTVVVPIGGQVSAGNSAPAVHFVLAWRNPDGTPRAEDFIFEPEGQDARIPWELVERTDPYDLEPVTTAEALVGRDDVLRELANLFSGRNVGSAFLWGQKRVGKTSIARTLETQLSKQPESPVVSYLEVGPYGAASIAETISSVTEAIARELRRAGPALGDLAIPQLDGGSAHNLLRFIDEALDRVGDRNIVLMLDEFDELPVKLFQADELARAFFQTLRALSGKPRVGILLVGGEKMNFVLTTHGDTLNKFRQWRVDYFSAERNWGDFCRMVREPTRDVLEIPDGSVAALYEQAAGHPYFTKMICRSMLGHALNARDAYVTPREVDKAVATAAEEAGTPSFQHFWTDGIRAGGSEQEAVSLARRKVLLGLAHCLRAQGPTTVEAISRETERYDVSRAQTASVLREFLERDVLMEDGDSFWPKIPFFQRWLTDYGVGQIITQLGDVDTASEIRRREEDAYVRPDEISALVLRWKTYQGREVTTDDVRAWLAQFGDNVSQRMMFKVLADLRFYNELIVREKFEEIHSRAFNKNFRKTHELLDHHIAVSYLGSPGKSGSAAARLYRQENQLFERNVLERSDLSQVIRSPDVKALIFVDDFLASGRSATDGLEELAPVLRAAAKAGTACFLGVVAAFEPGMKSVQKRCRKLGLRIRIVAGDLLTERDRVFHPEAEIFSTDEERLRAHDLAERIGKDLDRKQPLGYDGAEAAVVFGWNCPNNSLPILWKQGRNWRPLFMRV